MLIFWWLIQILNYMNREWIGSRLIEDKPEPLSVMSFEAQGEGDKKSMVSMQEINVKNNTEQTDKPNNIVSGERVN